jgi:hypothetical protein
VTTYPNTTSRSLHWPIIAQVDNERQRLAYRWLDALADYERHYVFDLAAVMSDQLDRCIAGSVTEAEALAMLATNDER